MHFHLTGTVIHKVGRALIKNMGVSCLCLGDVEFSSVCDMFEDVDHDIMDGQR